MANQINQAKPGAMQGGADLARLDTAGLPRMEREPAKPKATGAKMPARPEDGRPAAAAGAPTMTRFVAPTGPAADGIVKRRPDMKRHPAPAEAAPAARESYVRLRVRVVHGRMSIVGAQEIAGPLALSPAISGEHVYEAVLDSLPIATEGLLDVGVSRSYPRPGTHAHKFTERETYEFNVRIPRAALPGNALDRVGLTLYRLPDASTRLVQGRIAQQFGQQARTIARVDALRPAFDADARAQIVRMIPELPAR